MDQVYTQKILLIGQKRVREKRVELWISQIDLLFPKCQQLIWERQVGVAVEQISGIIISIKITGMQLRRSLLSF